MTEPEEPITPEDFINEFMDTGGFAARIVGDLGSYETPGHAGRAFPHVYQEGCCGQREQALIHDQFLATRYGEGGPRCPIVLQSTRGSSYLCLRHGVVMEREQLNCPAWGEL